MNLFKTIRVKLGGTRAISAGRKLRYSLSKWREMIKVMWHHLAQSERKLNPQFSIPSAPYHQSASFRTIIHPAPFLFWAGRARNRGEQREIYGRTTNHCDIIWCRKRINSLAATFADSFKFMFRRHSRSITLCHLTKLDLKSTHRAKAFKITVKFLKKFSKNFRIEPKVGFLIPRHSFYISRLIFISIIW